MEHDQPGGRVPWNAAQFAGKTAVGLVIAAALTAGAAMLWSSGASGPWGSTDKLIVNIVYWILALFLGGFLLVFTGRLSDTKVSWMIVYCYAFTWFFLIAPPLVFIGFPDAIGSPKPKDSPLGIVLGCAEHPVLQRHDVEGRTIQRDLTWIPKEIACGNNTPQWLVNIGGTVLPKDARKKMLADLKADYETGSSQHTYVNVGSGPNGAPLREVRTGEPRPVPVELMAYEAYTAAPPGETIMGADRVLGGVVVPLYFVIIALSGGLVSMMRRVPEYQRRLGSNSVNRITCEEAREYFVFQIMQVFSAPLIAIMAYYALEPASRASSIALAFIAGFSSETVLLQVRSLTSKLQPHADHQAQFVLTPSSVEFGNVRPGARSTPQSINITNRGTKTISLRDVSIAGDFQCSQPGAIFLPGGAHVEIEVHFVPSTTGEHRGRLLITSDAPGSPHVVTLSGKGMEA